MEWVQTVESREESIQLFERWLETKMEEFDSNVMGCLKEIIDHHEQYGEVNLVCFCKPKPCHGDIIKKYLEELA